MIELIKSIDITTWIYIAVGIPTAILLFIFSNRLAKFIKKLYFVINYWNWRRWNKKLMEQEEYGNDGA